MPHADEYNLQLVALFRFPETVSVVDASVQISEDEGVNEVMVGLVQGGVYVITSLGLLAAVALSLLTKRFAV